MSVDLCYVFRPDPVGRLSRPRMSNQQHLEILNAIAAGDETETARAFETHIITGKLRVLDTLT